MPDDPLDAYKHLLEDSKAALQDLEQERVQLHSTQQPPGTAPGALIRPRVSFGTPTVLGTPSGPLLRLASHFQEHFDSLKAFHDAGSAQRQQMLGDPTRRIQLFTIIFAQYRPGPAYLSQHRLPAGSFSARVSPGGPTWDSIVSGKPLDAWGRHALRLNQGATKHQGSGTLASDGRILTAGHVIYGPGYVFGKPPTQGTAAIAAANQVVGGQPLDLDISQFTPHASNDPDVCWITAPPSWPQRFQGTEFAQTKGLRFQRTALTAAQLAQIPHVAVIGHPGDALTVADKQGMPIAYPDGAIGGKRFMPGLIDASQPLTTIDGQELIRHDCSTLGGASGACLVDVATGVILGVHVSGISTADGRNHAVPAWLIPNLPA